MNRFHRITEEMSFVSLRNLNLIFFFSNNYLEQLTWKTWWWTWERSASNTGARVWARNTAWMSTRMTTWMTSRVREAGFKAYNSFKNVYTYVCYDKNKKSTGNSNCMENKAKENSLKTIYKTFWWWNRSCWKTGWSRWPEATWRKTRNTWVAAWNAWMTSRNTWMTTWYTWWQTAWSWLYKWLLIKSGSQCWSCTKRWWSLWAWNLRKHFY